MWRVPQPLFKIFFPGMKYWKKNNGSEMPGREIAGVEFQGEKKQKYQIREREMGKGKFRVRNLGDKITKGL